MDPVSSKRTDFTEVSFKSTELSILPILKDFFI